MELVHAAHVPAGEGPFPAFLALHGRGSNAHDLLGLAPILEEGQAVVVCPQGPLALARGSGMAGFAWVKPEGAGRADFEQARGSVLRFLDAALARYPMQRDKLVLLGFSQGGAVAYELFLREPERFSALVALSSWIPDAVLEGFAPTPALRNRPVLAIHGTQDTMIPVARARAARDALLPLGVSLTYREFEMGHELAPDALGELLRWLGTALHPIELAR
jgi:phospholipase/carboxylesterase